MATARSHLQQASLSVKTVLLDKPARLQTVLKALPVVPTAVRAHTRARPPISCASLALLALDLHQARLRALDVLQESTPTPPRRSHASHVLLVPSPIHRSANVPTAQLVHTTRSLVKPVASLVPLPLLPLLSGPRPIQLVRHVLVGSMPRPLAQLPAKHAVLVKERCRITLVVETVLLVNNP